MNCVILKEMWRQALATQAQLLWRTRKNMRFACEQRLADGSYLSRIYPSERDRRRRHQTNAIVLRVIEYRLEGVADAEPIYRLVTNVLDAQQAPAQELAALYHERWEIEAALDELKTHLRGARIVLRSKTPELVRQEFYGLLMAHFAVRALCTRRRCRRTWIPTGCRSCTRCASCVANPPPSTLFPPVHRKAFHDGVLQEILDERVARRRGRRNDVGLQVCKADIAHGWCFDVHARKTTILEDPCEYVHSAYFRVLGRPADPGGVNHFVATMQNGMRPGDC